MRIRPRRIIPFTLLLLLPASAAAATAPEPIRIGDSVTIHSAILGEDRPVFIHLPAGYERAPARYPVLYVLDGGVHWAYASTMADFFAANGMAPAHIVVGIPNTDRERDLTPMKAADRPQSGGGAAFLRFLREELFPHVERSYRTLPYRILYGHSLAGMFAVHTLLTAPEVFQAHIAASPWLIFGDGYILKRADDLLAKRMLPNAFLYMTVGDEPEVLPAVKAFRQWLERKNIPGLRWEMESLTKDNHGSLTLKTMYAGLEKLYAAWTLPQAKARKGAAAIEEHYAALSKTFGYEVRPPEGVVNQAGYLLLLQEKDAERAIAVFHLNVRLHPDSANVYDSLGEALEAAGKNDEAAKEYAKAVERGEFLKDPNLAVFKEHLQKVTK